MRLEERIRGWEAAGAGRRFPEVMMLVTGDGARRAEFERRLRTQIDDRIAGKVAPKTDFSKLDGDKLTLIDTHATWADAESLALRGIPIACAAPATKLQTWPIRNPPCGNATSMSSA